MADTIRIGAVSYLNTRPLVLGLEQGIGGERLALSYDVPSRLVGAMARGELDVALLPVVALADMPDLEIVPGLSIASFGETRSVQLLARKPLDSIATVGLDPASRTSNLLAQVLCADRWNIAPEFRPSAEDRLRALDDNDAVVRIGDAALFETPPEGVDNHDLGLAWSEATGLPFVYAVWAARPGVLDRELYTALHDSRRAGARQIELIAEDYPWKGMPRPGIALPYLRDHIDYRLGAAELEALERFLGRCATLGLIERAPELKLGLQRYTDCHRVAATRRIYRETT